MKKLDPKRQSVLRPQRPFVPKSDLAVLVVIQLAQKRRQIGPGRVKRFVCARLGLPGHIIQRHMHRFQPRKSEGRLRAHHYHD
jgi:hypothetical protein